MNARQLIQFESISMIPININLKCVLCTIDKSQLISATTFGGGGSSHGRPHAMTKIAGEVHKKTLFWKIHFCSPAFEAYIYINTVFRFPRKLPNFTLILYLF